MNEEELAQLADGLQKINFDRVSGGDRAMVDNLSTSPKSAVAYLKEKYPQHKFFINDKGEIGYQSPGRKEVTPLNPEGLDLGDVIGKAHMIPEMIAQGVGAAGGGAAGALLGGAGAIPGAMLGSAAATGATDLLKQKLGEMMGMENNMDYGQAGMNSAIAGALPAAGPLLKAGGKAIYNSAPLMKTLTHELGPAARDALFKMGAWGTNKGISADQKVAKNALEELIDTIAARSKDTGQVADIGAMKGELSSTLGKLKNPYTGVNKAEVAQEIESMNPLKKYEQFEPKDPSVKITERPAGISSENPYGTMMEKVEEQVPGQKGLDLPELITQKRDAYRAVPKSAWGTSSFGTEKEANKMVGELLKNESERLAERSLGGDAAKQLKELNGTWGDLIGADDLLHSQAKKTINAKVLGAVKPAVAVADPAAAAAMYGGQTLGSSWLPTSVGMGMNKVGKNMDKISPALLEFLRKNQSDMEE